jgi:hypothetical protein
MITGGKGGANTLTGLNFEKRISLREAFQRNSNYAVQANDLLCNGKVVAKLFQKYKLYSELLTPRGVIASTIVSKKLLPDESILVGNTLFIVEMKFQVISGSVDEKLQTCDFKLKQYRKLLAPLKIQVKYVYVLNDWFAKPEYKDVLAYVNDSGCDYFFNEIPLEFFGLQN